MARVIIDPCLDAFESRDPIQGFVCENATDVYLVLLLIADAVTVVLYSMMVAFAQMEGNVAGGQYALGIVSFFTISLGGLGIGILCGLLTALITRTTSEVRGILYIHAYLIASQLNGCVCFLHFFSGLVCR